MISQAEHQLQLLPDLRNRRNGEQLLSVLNAEGRQDRRLPVSICCYSAICLCQEVTAEGG